MEEKPQPPAPPAESATPAPSDVGDPAEPAYTTEERAEAAAALDAQEKQPKKLSADELVKKHLAEVAELEPEDHPEPHRLLVEHAEEAKLEPWQLRALLARFHAHGLHRHARIHPEVFKAALDEALHGRV